MQRDTSKLPATLSGPAPAGGEQQQPWPGERMFLCCRERFLVVAAEGPTSHLMRWALTTGGWAPQDIFILGKGWASSRFIWSLSASQQQFRRYIPVSATPSPSCDELSEDLPSSTSRMPTVGYSRGFWWLAWLMFM